MFKKRFFLILMLFCGGGCLVLGQDVWNVRTDWSDHNNPNSVWSYRDSTGNLLSDNSYPSSTLGGAPYGWQPGANLGPTLFHDPWYLMGSNSGNGLNAVNGHGSWKVVWESPVEGWIRISGKGFQSYTGPRWMYFTMSHNGVPFTGWYSIEDPVGGGALGGWNIAPVDFTSGSGGTEALVRYVSVGDTIEVLTTGSLGPNGTGTDSQSTFASLEMQIEVVTNFEVSLTMQTNLAAVDTVSPAVGVNGAPFGSNVPITASRYVHCPDVMVFDHWECSSGGIENPFSSSTTVLMNQDKIVTAYYVDDRQCGDECHPIVDYDSTGDCLVDISDFLDFIAAWLNCTAPECD